MPRVYGIDLKTSDIVIGAVIRNIAPPIKCESSRPKYGDTQDEMKKIALRILKHFFLIRNKESKNLMGTAVHSKRETSIHKKLRMMMMRQMKRVNIIERERSCSLI